MKQARVRRAGLKHAGTCDQRVFPSDNRYTHCSICGTQRFYKDGFKGELAWVKVSAKKR